MTQLKGGGGGEPGHSNRVQCVKYDKEDLNLCVSGGWDKTVLVWDIRTGEAVKSIFGPYIGGESLDIHDGIILTGAFQSDKQLQLWELSTAMPLDTIEWNEGLVSPERTKIISS